MIHFNVFVVIQEWPLCVCASCFMSDVILPLEQSENGCRLDDLECMYGYTWAFFSRCSSFTEVSVSTRVQNVAAVRSRPIFLIFSLISFPVILEGPSYH